MNLFFLGGGWPLRGELVFQGGPEGEKKIHIIFNNMKIKYKKNSPSAAFSNYFLYTNKIIIE